jgi:ATP synthase protein I
VTDPDQRERMAQLEARIDRFKSKDKPETSHQNESYSQAQLAWRMVIELVTGLGIGFGMGYGLDSLLETTPAFLVVFTMLGFVAGIKTMLRSAKEIQLTEADKAADDETPDGADEKRVKDGD